MGPRSRAPADAATVVLREDEAAAAPVGTTFTGMSPNGLLLLDTGFFIEKSNGGCLQHASPPADSAAAAAAASSAHELVDDTAGSSQYTKGPPASDRPCTAVNALVRCRPTVGGGGGGGGWC